MNFFEAVREGIRATQCGLLGFDEWTLGAVGRLSPALRDLGLDTVNAYRRILGCDPADDAETPPPEFTGGQCPGVVYTVVLSGSASSTQSGTATRVVEGPVGGVCFGPVNQFGVQAIGVSGANGCVTQGSGIATTRPTTAGTWQIVSVTRDDGQLDDCGNPPPVYPPPVPRPIDIDITFQPDFGPEITVPITINYSPFEVAFNGDVVVPFNFDFGGFTFDGEFNFNPDIDIRINPPRLPPGSGEDLTGQGEDEPGETTPPAPPDQKIIGIVVTATEVGQGRITQIFNDGMPPTFAPRLGSVKFVYSIGGATFFSSDIDIKDRRTFIECPFSQGADAAIASPQPGVELTFTEIRGYPLATTGDIRPAT